jgi:hypothetical protein
LAANRLILSPDERSSQVDLVYVGRTIPVADCDAGRNHGPSTPLNVLRRRSPKRPVLNNIDRLVFVGLYRVAPQVLEMLQIIKPETVIRWHRTGFRAYWRWKSRPRGGRPRTPYEIRALIREVSFANPLWGAPPIHGELLKLGIDVGQTTVAKYMAKHRRPPSQGWRTFLHNHADGIASMDLFVVPTISFRLLYGLLILQHGRRQILWLGVTATQRPSGSHASSQRPTVGLQRRDTSSVTATLFTATSSFVAFVRWAFVTGLLQRDRDGKTDMRNA